MIEALIPVAIGLISGAGGALIAAKMAIARLEVHFQYQDERGREALREARAANRRLDLIRAPAAAVGCE